MYQTLIERSAGLFPHAPNEILDCGGIEGNAYLWWVRWAVYETFGEWRKYGTADCWALYDHGKRKLPGCGRTIHVKHSDGTHIRMPHEIALERVAEIVRVMRATLPEGDRIFEIQYTGVPGDGSWSLTEHGYSVSTWHAHHGSGESYAVVMDCTPTPCQWQVTKRGTGWVY